MKHVWIGAVVALCLVATPALAQGKHGYFNVESPQVHPIEVARIGGHDYLLICNTADNSVEIWDTDESRPVAQRFLQRVPVGLEPVSVRWIPRMGRAYVANFLGDSISSISFDVATGDPASLNARVVATQEVTDEPLDIAFAQIPGVGEVGGPIELVPALFVTHMTLDAVGKYDARTLAPLRPGSELTDAVVATGADIDFDGQLDDIALKEPRTIGTACNRLWVLGHKGGNTVRYDFDLYSSNLNVDGTGATALGGLGSHNANMAFGDDGDLFVVGGMARNELRDESAVAAARSGFVKSMFYWVRDVCSNNPRVLARDVNLRRVALQPTEVAAVDAGPIGLALPGTQSLPGQQALPGAMPDTSAVSLVQTAARVGPVPKALALAQPTDVVPFRRPGAALKVFFTAFSSDRVGVIQPRANVAPIRWPIRRIQIPSLSASMAGPRGLALKPADPASISTDATSAGARLYVLNRIDNSVTIIDPVSEDVLDSFELNREVTPGYIVAGRRFLYDARLSGNGFVSCSSCHVDGRTDSLAWDLGGEGSNPIPPHLLPNPNFPNVWPADKEFMVTQSFQGLLNWEVQQEAQQLFTNGPYHWRIDRATFLAFNGAFASLLGGSELGDDQMVAFEEFVNSIQYPPNPKQPRSRVYTGDLGDPLDANTTQPTSGSGAMLGMKIFHSAGAANCAACHALPDGSDNGITEQFPTINPHPVPDPPLVAEPINQPVETAAMRFLYQKEARLTRNPTDFVDDAAITGYEGLLHGGLFPNNPNRQMDFHGSGSLNAFMQTFFTQICGGGQEPFCSNVQAFNAFLHQFDTGAGPMIGRSHTVDAASRTSAATIAAFDDVEEQSRLANAGAAVLVWTSLGVRGFWLDQSVQPAVYREDATNAGLSRAELLALLNNAGDRLVVLAVPLGSERRVGHPDGRPSWLDGPAPSELRLMPMIPNTAYAEVPRLTLLWDPGANQAGGTDNHTTRLYQKGVLAYSNGFGLCSPRHEAPRRFRVAGRDIRHGARLQLFVQDDPNAGPPVPDLGPRAAGQVATMMIELPLHASADRAEGLPVWQTSAELESMLIYRLLAGRPDQAQFPGVMVGLTDRDFTFAIDEDLSVLPAPLFDPVAWNRHWVRVVNEDGTAGDGGWQPLSIQPGPDCP